MCFRANVTNFLFSKRGILVFNQEKVKALYYISFLDQKMSQFSTIAAGLMAQFCYFYGEIFRFAAILIQEYGRVIRIVDWNGFFYCIELIPQAIYLKTFLTSS